MYSRKLFAMLLLCLISSLLSTIVFAANGTITGSVKDAQTGEPLPGANILIVGTSLGTASDLNGEYTLPKVPAGEYTLRVTYIGYEQLEVRVKIVAEAKVNQDLKLKFVGVQMGEVVVTAQAEGQMQAINQQLSSPSIVNIVSSARIQEFPDANAAESIRRLPGVSITRVGGEGTQVVIRGLAPKYNAITINGVRMASSNSSDRSADLSIISSNMLEGIEVFKTITADQDADILGGTVNFKIKGAQGGKKGLGLNLLAQQGYTGLSNAYHKYDNYKYVSSVEGRFFKERLGAFLQANLERRNLTSNEFGATYTNKSADPINYITQSLNLRYIPRDRQRLNGAIYNLHGQQLRTLVNERKAIGSYTAKWDGRDQFGRAVVSGVYFYKLVAGEFVQTRKMLFGNKVPSSNVRSPRPISLIESSPVTTTRPLLWSRLSL
jgi:outer membrane receptor for ferrienterochelin and colicin